MFELTLVLTTVSTSVYFTFTILNQFLPFWHNSQCIRQITQMFTRAYMLVQL